MDATVLISESPYVIKFPDDPSPMTPNDDSQIFFNRSYSTPPDVSSLDQNDVYPSPTSTVLSIHSALSNMSSIDPKTFQQVYQILMYYKMAHNFSQHDASPELWQKLILNLTSELQATHKPWRKSTHSDMDADDQNLYEVPTGIVVLLSLFYGVISLVAVVGNALVMWVVATSRLLHSVTNYFIANLALADIIIGLFCIPFQFQAALLQRWNLPEFMCAFCPFFQTLSVNVSIFTLTAIAVDRYRAICFPFGTRPSKFRSRVVLVSIWTLSSLLAAPTAVALRVTQEMDYRTGAMVPRCKSLNMDKELFSTYSHLLVGIQYFLPLGIVSFAYFKIARKLWGSRTPGNAEDARDAHVLKNKKKAIKMLFVVVAMFAVCWLPLQTYHVFQVIYPHINEYKYINIIWFIFHWLAMSNSCVNPFIYAIYNEKFKREFQHKCRCCVRGGGGLPYDLSDGDRSRISLHSSRYRSTRTSFLDQLAVLGGSQKTPRLSGGTAVVDGFQRSNYPLSRHDSNRNSLTLARSAQPLHELNALPPHGSSPRNLLSAKTVTARLKSRQDCHLPGYFTVRRNSREQRMARGSVGSGVSRVNEDFASETSSFQERTVETSFNGADSLQSPEGISDALLTAKHNQNGVPLNY